MSNPNEVPQPQQPDAQPPQGTPQPPPGYQAPPPGYQQPAPGYQAPGYQAPPPGYQAPPPGYQAPPPGYQQAAGPNNAPPAGLGYAAPARNAFGLDFNNIAQRLKDTTGVPQQLVISYWLWVAAAALGVVLGIINIAIAAGQYSGLFVGAAITGLIIGLIFAAFYVFCAIRLKEGARWSRIVLTVLGALAVIGLFSQILAGSLTLIGSAAAVAAAIFMWLPESQKHFV
jgi:hypothetical protein